MKQIWCYFIPPEATQADCNYVMYKVTPSKLNSDPNVVSPAPLPKYQKNLQIKAGVEHIIHLQLTERCGSLK